MTTHMDGHLTPAQIAQRRREADEAEVFAAKYLGGIVDNRLPDHDVRDRNGRPYEVKHPRIGFSYVDGGDRTHHPVHCAIVVERHRSGSLSVAGFVEPRDWRWGEPMPGFAGRWYVLRKDLASDTLEPPGISPRRTDEVPEPTQESSEAPPAKLALGVDRVEPLSASEMKKLRDAKADKRRQARVKSAEGLGWAFPDDVPRGLGDNPGTGRRAVVKGEDE